MFLQQASYTPSFGGLGFKSLELFTRYLDGASLSASCLGRTDLAQALQQYQGASLSISCFLQLVNVVY